MAAPRGYPEVNKFEQVFNDVHEMSLAGGPLQWGPMSGGRSTGVYTVRSNAS